MSEHVDHVVVGGGVMGAAAAWQLARRGRQVVLLERFGRGHVRGASHGASRIYRNTYARAEYLDLVQEAFDLWRVLEDEAPAVGELLTITGGVSQGSLGVARGGRGVRRRAASRTSGCPPPTRTRAGRASRSRVTSCTRPAPRAACTPTARSRRSSRPRSLPVRACCTRRRSWRSSRPATACGWSPTPAPGTRCSVVVAVGAWTSGLLGGVPELADRLVVTQEQPAHFALRPDAPAAELWPSFTHDPPAPHPWPSGVYGLATPGEGIKVGFHGVGPRTDPDRRTFTPEPGQLRRCVTTSRSGCPAPIPTTSSPSPAPTRPRRTTTSSSTDGDVSSSRPGSPGTASSSRRPSAACSPTWRPNLRTHPRARRTPPSPPPGSPPCRSDLEPPPRSLHDHERAAVHPRAGDRRCRPDRRGRPARDPRPRGRGRPARVPTALVRGAPPLARRRVGGARGARSPRRGPHPPPARRVGCRAAGHDEPADRGRAVRHDRSAAPRPRRPRPGSGAHAAA